MKKTSCRTGALPVAAALMGALLAVLPGASWAQVAQAQNPPPPPAARGETDPARMRTLDTVVSEMSRASGAIILADSSVASQSVPLPKETTAQNFESQLDAIVKALPPASAATWAKVYLPISSSSRRLDPDAVTDYVMAQAHLFGTVGAAAPTGMVEIMGQRVAADKAAPVITTLNLKPVYIVTSTRARSTMVADGTQQNWNQMTPEQRQQAAQQQAQQLMSLSPQDRTAYLQQQMATVRAMMQQMSPDQQRQMFQSMGGMGGFGGGGRRMRGGGGQQ